jgi:hypothetical protein
VTSAGGRRRLAPVQPANLILNYVLSEVRVNCIGGGQLFYEFVPA